MVSDFDFGWLVGVLEGEAYFGFNSKTYRVDISMVDEDTICRCAKIMGELVGESLVVTSKMPSGDRQELYNIVITGARAKRLMLIVVKYMRYRRRAQIWQALNKYNRKKVTLKQAGFDFSKVIVGRFANGTV